MKKLILGGLLGGLIVFVWGMVSWMVLPWHNLSMRKFTDESAVEKVLTANAPHGGLYVLPNGCAGTENLSPDQKKAAMKVSFEKMEKGPSAFVVFRPNGTGKMFINMAKGIALQMLLALMMTSLLLKAKPEHYSCRLGLVVMIALTAGLMCHVPNWIWWKFPTKYVAVEIADLVVSWFLAGLVLAKIAVVCDEKEA